MLIAYAAAPGKEALDGDDRVSPFTKSLVKHIRAPGVPISDTMGKVGLDVLHETANRQVPWVVSRLTAPFYPGAADAAALGHDDPALAEFGTCRDAVRSGGSDIAHRIAAFPRRTSARERATPASILFRRRWAKTGATPHSYAPQAAARPWNATGKPPCAFYRHGSRRNPPPRPPAEIGGR